MDPFFIEQTFQTPRIAFDAATGSGEIEGSSFPENAFEFYAGAMEWLEQYFAEGSTKFDLTLSITYFNTASTKVIRNLLTRMNEFYNNEKSIRITWYHEDGDDDMEEFGKSYAVKLDVPIEVKAY